MRRTGGFVEFVSQRRTRDQDYKKDGGRSEFTEQIFEENIQLETEGFVYHPNLFEFTLAGLFGLLQHDTEILSGGLHQNSRGDGTIVEYDFEGHVLKRKQFPGLIQARRHQVTEPRAFQPSLETTTTTYGVLWQYISDVTPTTLQFDYIDLKMDPLSGTEENTHRRSTDLQFKTEYRFNMHNIFSFDYSHDTLREEPRERDYDADEVDLSHVLEFGPGHRNRLDSDLNYRDQRGLLSLERFRWREVFQLRYSKWWRSWVKLEMLDRKRGSLSGVPDIHERSYYASASLEHRLYESLISELSLYFLDQTFDSGVALDQYGVHVALDYQKRNRWGQLAIDYTFGYDREDHEGPHQALERLDEEYTFRDPFPLLLTAPRIDTMSIVITNVSRTTVYQEGTDYRVEVIGDRVEVHRVITGRIADGETVLVDYMVRLGGTFRLDTISQNLSVQQRFEFGLTPYYKLQRQDQRLTPKKAIGVIPEDITAHTYGLEYRRKSLSLTAEYETRKSTLTPYDSIRLIADYTRRFKFGATGTIRARWIDAEYDPPYARTSRFFTVEGRVRYPVSTQLKLEGSVVYRNEKDSLSGDDTGVDLDLSLEWRVRKTEVKVTYEYGRFDDDYARSDDSTLYVEVRRRF